MDYKETDKMFDVICDRYQLLQMLSRFGISLGFGEQTVREVCEANKVDVATFLAVANYIKRGSEAAPFYAEHISVSAIMAYLRQAHAYFLDFQLPNIRQRLVSAIDCSQANEAAFLILKFYDEYMREVRRHMEFENRRMFVYVDGLLSGQRPDEQGIAQFARAHEGINRRLQELKNVIIKYYKGEGSSQLLNTVLLDIFNLEADLHEHCCMEDDLFIPAVEQLEVRNSQSTARRPADGQQPAASEEALSEREKEIVTCIARGMSNKEVAEHLFISVNTVLTHRKNIFRKLGVHSVNGLTIYAVVNGLLRLDDIRQR